MSIALIDAASGAVVSSSDYNTNNTTLENAINSFDGGNISVGTVANSALANSEAEFHLAFDGILGASLTTVYLPVSVNNDLVVKGAAYYTSDNGTGPGTVTVTAGTISSGTYTAGVTLVNGASIPSGSNQAAAGVLTASGSITSSHNVLSLVFNRGTGQNSNATDFFRLTLRCVSALTT